MRRGKNWKGIAGWRGLGGGVEGGLKQVWSSGEYHAGAVIELWERHENAKQSDKSDNVALNLLPW